MDYLTGNQFLTLNDYKNIEKNQNEYNFQIGGEVSTLQITVCIGIVLLYMSITILVIVYFNKNKTNGMEKNDIIKKNSLFVLLMIIFSACIYSSMYIEDVFNKFLLISSMIGILGLSTSGIFYFAL